MAIGRAMCQITKARVTGRKFFHTKCINWSYRNRGYEARTHKNKTDNRAAFVIKLTAVSSGKRGICNAPKNKTVERVFINRILEYSARKNRANGPPAYSTLNPETSSDSPSVRSKGARFVSANVDTYHIAANGHAGITSHVDSWATLNVCSVNPPVIMITESKISPRLTSYEIVCATARRAPIRAYFEFEAQPEPKIEYTAKLERARTKRIPKFRSTTGYGIGIGAHSVRARIKAIIGVIRNRNGDEVDGRTGSLIKSLTPSAIGWSNPYGPTTLGPLRSCIYPKTFRSSKVKNATASSTGTIYANGLRICVIRVVITKERI